MKDDKPREPTVVVVGGGFAGVACAKHLSKHGVRVTLVDRHDYNQFQPLLYQVATAQVERLGGRTSDATDVPQAHRVAVQMALITSVDPVAKTVTASDGITFAGDYLVLAMGSEPNFFDTPGAESNAFTLYSLEGAQRLRSRLLTVFEDVFRNPKLIEQGALNFVIVGAGATGVETAGALADAINRIIPRRVDATVFDAACIHVIDPGAVVLAPFSERSHTYARHSARGAWGEGRARCQRDRGRPEPGHALGRPHDPDPHGRLGRRCASRRASRGGPEFLRATADGSTSSPI